MLLDHQVRQLFHDLIRHEAARVVLGRNEVYVRIFEDSMKVSLSTVVYEGDKFIPQSVRRSVTKETQTGPGEIQTTRVIDEGKYQVRLNYLGSADTLDFKKFKQLFQEFLWSAEEWRELLEEQDGNDLVRVSV